MPWWCPGRSGHRYRVWADWGGSPVGPAGAAAADHSSPRCGIRARCGRHRYEAFKAEGITECLMHISEPASLDREAIELNRASEDALPMTFVDYAEMVWRKQSVGATQKAIGDELGWRDRCPARQRLPIRHHRHRASLRPRPRARSRDRCRPAGPAPSPGWRCGCDTPRPAP